MPAAKKTSTSTQNSTTSAPRKKPRSTTLISVEISGPSLEAQSQHSGPSPISTKPGLNSTGNGTIDWQATSDDWEQLGSTRNRRGWQLVALSLGYQPIRGIGRRLPEIESKQYKRRLRVLRNSTTDKRSTTKLQFERNVLYQGKKSNPDDPIEFSFDVVKFVDFFARLPTGGDLHPALVAAAEEFRLSDAKTQTVQPVPTRNANAAVSRIEGSLWDIVLGLALKHYEFVPVGLAGMASKRDENKGIVEEMVEDICDAGLTVTAEVVGKRLNEATQRLSKREDDREKVRLFIANRK